MKKIVFSILAAAAAQAAVASPAPDVTLRVTPERDLIYRPGPREMIIQVEIDGRKVEDAARRTPMNLAIVFDRSGSMEGAKIEKARQAAVTAVEKLADDDYFSLVTYDTETNVLIEAQRVGNHENRERLKAAIHRIQAGSSTALHAGVVLGARQVRDRFSRDRVNRVILLSDGLANVGPSHPSDLARLGRELRGDGISVSTIGLGDDYNEDLMTALAEASHANYYYVQDAEKLPEVFAKELGASRSLLARGVLIRIEVPEGVRVKEIVGRLEIECRDRRAEIKLAEMFGAEKRRFLVRCVAEKEFTDALEAAQVELKYDTADGQAAPAQRQAVRVAFTDDAKRAEESIRSEVARELGVVKNRLAKELAVKLADEGKAKDAVAVLRQQAAVNASAPAAAQIPNTAAENKRLEEVAAELDSRGRLEKSRRKEVQFENYADKYQKERPN